MARYGKESIEISDAEELGEEKEVRPEERGRGTQGRQEPGEGSPLRAEITAAVAAEDAGRLQAAIEGDPASFAELRGHAGSGGSLLLAACRASSEAGALALCRLLLAAGAAVDRKDDTGRTPLHEAATRGRDELAALLLGEGAEVDARDDAGRSALHLAAARNRLSTAALLADNGADLDLLDANGETCLFAAKRCCHMRIARLLIERGVNQKVVNKSGLTADLIDRILPAKETLVISSSEKSEISKAKENESEATLSNIAHNSNNQEERNSKVQEICNQEEDEDAKNFENNSVNSQEELITGQTMSYFNQAAPKVLPNRKVAKKTLEQSKPAKSRNKKKGRVKYSLVRTDFDGVAHAVTNESSLAFRVAHPEAARLMEAPDTSLPQPLPTASHQLLATADPRAEAKLLTVAGRPLALPPLFAAKAAWLPLARHLLQLLKKPPNKTLLKKRLFKGNKAIENDAADRSPALIFFSRLFTSANFSVGQQAGIMLSKKDQHSGFQPRQAIRAGLYPNAVRPCQLDKLLSKPEPSAKALSDRVDPDLDSRKHQDAKHLEITTLLHIPDLASIFRGPASLHTVSSKLKYNCYPNFSDFFYEVLSVFEGWLIYCGIWNEVGVLAFKSMKYWNQLVQQEVDKEIVKNNKTGTKVNFKQVIAHQGYSNGRSPINGRLRNHQFPRGITRAYDGQANVGGAAHFEQSIDPSIREIIDAAQAARAPALSSGLQPAMPSRAGPLGQSRGHYQPSAAADERDLGSQPRGHYGLVTGAGRTLGHYGFRPSGVAHAPGPGFAALDDNQLALARLAAPAKAPARSAHVMAGMASSSGHLRQTTAPNAPTRDAEASDDSFDFAVNHESD